MNDICFVLKKASSKSLDSALVRGDPNPRDRGLSHIDDNYILWPSVLNHALSIAADFFRRIDPFNSNI